MKWNLDDVVGVIYNDVPVGTNTEGETISLAETVIYSDNAKRPLWFVYSGMGSQWAGMGAQLMRIPIFAAAIER